jgi:hypothetical protein
VLKSVEKNWAQSCIWKRIFLLMLTFHVLFQEYIQDGIDWTKVDFEDNQDCLSLFEKVQNMMHQMYFLDFSIIGSIENN